MIKRYFSFVLGCLLLIAANASVISAQTNAANSAADTAQIKAKVIKRGSRKNTSAKVKLLDGRKLSGKITETGDDSFTLTDSKTNQTTTIAYRDVAQVTGKGFSNNNIIALGALAAAAVIVLVIVVAPICNEGGC